jgi:hypothetical protein
VNRRLRILIIAVACVVLAFVAATLGYAFTRGGGPHKPRYPGRLAVRDGCGLRHMFFDGSDQRMLCLQGVFDTVSVSRNGDKLAWDTTGGQSIIVSGADGFNPVNVPLPLGSNAAPSLAPDGTKIAFLHAPPQRRQVRHLGHVHDRPERRAGHEHPQRLGRRVVADGRLARVRPELVPGHT